MISHEGTVEWYMSRDNAQHKAKYVVTGKLNHFNEVCRSATKKVATAQKIKKNAWNVVMWIRKLAQYRCKNDRDIDAVTTKSFSFSSITPVIIRKLCSKRE